MRSDQRGSIEIPKAAPPHTKPSRRTTLIIVLFFVGALFAALRMFREVVPVGASPIPFLFARVEGGELRDPSGSAVFRVSFNNGGATHSGNHWCWISSYSALSGWRVVLEGYVGPEHAISGEPLKIDWSTPKVMRMKFRESRYAHERRVWRESNW